MTDKLSDYLILKAHLIEVFQISLKAIFQILFLFNMKKRSLSLKVFFLGLRIYI